jgi:carboxyl-terminal processing protease
MKAWPRAAALVAGVMVWLAGAGCFCGQQAATPPLPSENDIQTSIGTFTRAYEAIEQNCADPLDPDVAIFGRSNSGQGAIPGMLRTLDPHSTFFDPRAYALLREQQEGRYYGVGMRIQASAGKTGNLETMVVETMQDSPAFRAGLRPGDILISVDGKPTEGLDTSIVASFLKGPRGTAVHVAVEREGSPKPLDFAVVRDAITSPTVDDAFLVRPHVAYIRITGFSETTNHELTEALEKLDPKTLQGLVLDLRGNPGGLLEQAVEVADHFLRKNQLIVYHSGRQSQEMRYYATQGDDGMEYPMVVLINRMTASAAEIVTGALQDHDRALVMGEPSFGKGLVQTVYPLSDNTGLALTTAHYYTPSGRLIQRDYSKVSLYDYYYHFDGNTIPHTEVRLTDGGREVYGGGGIMPDVVVPRLELNAAQETLLQHEAFFEFGRHYLAEHPAVPRDFVPDGKTLEEFGQFLDQQGIALKPADLAALRQYVSRSIQAQLLTVLYGTAEGDKVTVESDPLVSMAIENLGRAKQLTLTAKRFIASKREQ